MPPQRWDEDLEVLRKDLEAYDNPESFYDPNLPLRHHLQIKHLMPGDTDPPCMLEVDVHGDEVILMLRRAFFVMLRNFAEAQLIEDYGVQDWETVCAQIETEDDYLEVEQSMFYFFARNMPKLLVRLYNILFLMTEFSALRYHLDERERGETESGVKKQLAEAIRAMEKDIYRMLETRSKGRPTGSTKSPEEKLQEANDFEKRIEETIREFERNAGTFPTKTAVAKELGIGGLNPKTGIDSSLNSFNNKLKRLKIDYEAIVERIRLNK